VVIKTTQLNGIMTSDPLSSTPIPTPATDALMVFGDTVVSRHVVRGTAITSIFVKKNRDQFLLCMAVAAGLAALALPAIQ
jgi:hypothetical protein